VLAAGHVTRSNLGGRRTVPQLPDPIAAVEQQTATIGELSRNIGHAVAGISSGGAITTTSYSMTQARTATTELARAGINLQGLVNQFGYTTNPAGTITTTRGGSNCSSSDTVGPPG